jgi:hypothetical protein
VQALLQFEDDAGEIIQGDAAGHGKSDVLAFFATYLDGMAAAWSWGSFHLASDKIL